MTKTPASPPAIVEMPTHEVCELFPTMDDAAFAELCRDVKAHGLREPIVTFEGKVIDGRNRLRACRAVGLEPWIEEWDGDGDLLAFVVSLNLHRRHLTPSQRAMVADKIATFRDGGDRRSADQSANLRTEISHAKAAEMVGVSPRSVEAASVVRSKGTPKLAEAGGRVVGFIVYELRPEKIRVLRFAVAADCRRMVARLAGKLSANRRTCVEWEVSDRDLGAHLFLKACGAEAVGVLWGLRDGDPDHYTFRLRHREPAPAAGVPTLKPWEAW